MTPPAFLMNTSIVTGVPLPSATGLRYQFIEKDSNVPFRDYTQNRVSFDGTYSF